MNFSEFIPPFSDFGFKNLFGKEGPAKENLIILLNSILHEQLGFERIVDLAFSPTENKASHPDEKTTHYDIHCLTDTGHRIIVEMQNRWLPNFQDRILYYVSEAVSRQGRRITGRDAWDYTLDPVIGLAFCNYVMPGFGNEPLLYFELRDRITEKPYSREFGIAFIHIPEFREEMEECITELQKIIYSLKNMDKIQTMEQVPFSTGENDFYQRVKLMSRVSALSEDERLEYDRWLKHENDRKLREQYIEEMAVARGLKKGIAEGREKGIAEGREKGFAEGRNEAKWETARNLNSMGVDIKTISAATGISEEDLKANL